MKSEKANRQLRKEREIGTDPKYWHSRGFHNWDIREELSKEWKKKSKQWDQDNG